MGLAQAATVQMAATWMLEEARPEAVFVHHPWLGQIRHASKTRPGSDFASALPAAWRFLDGLMGRLAAVAGPETLVLMVSPGWRSAPGVVLAVGAGVDPSDDTFQGASLLDIAPTALAHFGLEDVSLRGRRLASVAAVEPLKLASAPPPIEAPAKPDPLLAYTLRKQGYRAPPMPGRIWRAEGLAELAFMMLERDPAGAGRVAQAALLQDSANIVALRAKVRAHVVLGEAEPLPVLGDRLLELAPDRGWGPLAHGAHHVLRGEKALASKWLVRAETDPDVSTLLTVAGVWLAASRYDAAGRVFKAILAADASNVTADVGLDITHIRRRNFIDAEFGLLRALKHDPGRPAIYLQLAQVYAHTGRKADADRSLAIAIGMGAAPATAAATRLGRSQG
jgi:tetratricopeptide (TPR) repeat protein